MENSTVTLHYVNLFSVRAASGQIRRNGLLCRILMETSPFTTYNMFSFITPNNNVEVSNCLYKQFYESRCIYLPWSTHNPVETRLTALT